MGNFASIEKLELTGMEALFCRDEGEEASEENAVEGEEALEEYSSEEDDANKKHELEGELKSRCIYSSRKSSRFIKKLYRFTAKKSEEKIERYNGPKKIVLRLYQTRSRWVVNSALISVVKPCL